MHVDVYKEHKIELTPEFVFEVTGEAFVMEMQRKFVSLRDARNAIDDRVGALAKQKKAQATLSLPALDRIGEPFVIRGINSVSSRVLGVDDKGELYAPGQWVSALLKERAAIRKRLNDIDNELRPVHVPARRGYGNLSVEKYEAAIAALQLDYDKAKVAAQAKA